MLYQVLKHEANCVNNLKNFIHSYTNVKVSGNLSLENLTDVKFSRVTVSDIQTHIKHHLLLCFLHELLNGVF